VRRLTALLGAAVLCAALTAGGVASPAAKLRANEAGLSARQHSAVLELYALQSRLAKNEERLATLRAQLAVTEERLARLRVALDVAWRSVYIAEERLGARIRQLYVHGQLDPVAILLGAESLDEAVDKIEGLRSIASGDRDLLRQVRKARVELSAAKRAVSRRADDLRAAENAAAQTSSSLREATSARRAYIAELRRERGLTRRQIARAEQAATEAQGRTHQLAEASAPASAAPAPAPTAAPAPVDGQQLTVSATAYAIHGTTATGIQTGWGVVAVDPSVIPLGTRMTIPGYGEGVAADTGSAVQGNTIDLWFPTVAEALAWGRRTVTITLHG
jgi:3D (Asp-Asp-Asp) domain-containing protein